MRVFLFSVILFSSLVIVSCESPVPSSNDSTEGKEGSGVWACLNQDLTDNAVIKKMGFDGKEMESLPRCQKALDVALADGTGAVWTSQLGIDGYYRIIKYTDSGEELLCFEQQDAGFLFQAHNLAPNLIDGSCWFTSFIGAESHVCRIGPGGGLLVDNTEFDLPVEVSAWATDGSCWVLDKAALLVSRLDVDGNRMFDRSLDGHIPRCLTVDPVDGDCWVGYDNIIVKYSPLGEVLLEQVLEYQINRIAVHPTNHSICIQSGFDLVDKYDGLGDFGWRFYTGGTVSDIQMTVNDGIWVVNSELHGIYKVSDAGVQEAAFSFAFSPSALAVYEKSE